jgi:hypothetical protein
MMTKRHARRVNLNSLESTSRDHASVTDEALLQGVARRALEDRKMLRELGLSYGDVDFAKSEVASGRLAGGEA